MFGLSENAVHFSLPSSWWSILLGLCIQFILVKRLQPLKHIYTSSATHNSRRNIADRISLMLFSTFVSGTSTVIVHGSVFVYEHILVLFLHVFFLSDK